MKDLLSTVEQYEWLTSKFGLEGNYQDIAGLCKIASQEDIKAKGYTLTPGAYVGVAEVTRDGQDFAERMKIIHEDLVSLQEKSQALIGKIDADFKRLGL